MIYREEDQKIEVDTYKVHKLFKQNDNASQQPKQYKILKKSENKTIF